MWRGEKVNQAKGRERALHGWAQHVQRGYGRRKGGVFKSCSRTKRGELKMKLEAAGGQAFEVFAALRRADFTRKGQSTNPTLFICSLQTPVQRKLRQIPVR